MTIQEVILTRQIELNNNWPEVVDVETEALNYVRERMKEMGVSQIMVPVRVKSDAAFSTLSKDKQLAKVFSAFLDTYDMLPLHPDLAFDAIWRTLEYSIRLYANRAWGYAKDKALDDIYAKFSTEVVSAIVNKEPALQRAFANLLENTSISAAQYMTYRIFFEKQLSVAPQFGFVKARTESIIQKELLIDLRSHYSDENGNMDTASVRDVARRLIRLFQGRDVQVGDNTYRPMAFNDRIEMLLSVMLYTSRCERFHGDIYSPFKSSKTKLTTYYEYYFLTLCSLIVFWILFYKLIERESNGLVQCIDFNNLESAINTSIERMNAILSNKQ